MKRLKSIFLRFMLVIMLLMLFGVPRGITGHAKEQLEQTTKASEEGVDWKKFTNSEYNSYRTSGENIAPKSDKPGYVFAGWYKSANDVSTNVLSDAVLQNGATAYAKFVDADVLTVKARIPLSAYVTDEKIDIQFVTTVDSLNYREVGFDITINGIKKTFPLKTVYTQLYSVGKDSETFDSLVASEEFCSSSEYFCAYSVWGVPNAHFDTGIVVTPFWTTLDGTRVEGETSTRTVSAGYTYDGAGEFNGVGKQICSEEFIRITGNAGTEYEQPYVENGVLNMKFYAGTRSVRFSATQLVGEDVLAGDTVKITVRMKPDNYGNFKIYHEPQGQGDSYFRFLHDTITPEDGWFIFTYESKINVKDSDWLYDPNGATTVWPNIGFVFTWTGSALSQTNSKSVQIDYIRVESSYSGGWEFDKTVKSICDDDYLHITGTKGVAYEQPYVENHNLHMTFLENTRSIRLSAAQLLEHGCAVGDDVDVEIRFKVDNPSQFKICTAEWGVEKFSYLSELDTEIDDDGYYILKFKTKINQKDSEWMFNPNSATQNWANVAFAIQWSTWTAGNKYHLDIDYIRVTKSIANFESLAELYTMSFRNDFGEIDINNDEQYITSGSHSMKLVIAGKKSKAGEYEKVWFHIPISSDFTNTEQLRYAKALCVDVYSVSDEPLEICLNMNYSNNKYGDQSPFSKQILQKGWNSLRFEIPIGIWEWETFVSSISTLDFVISGRSKDAEEPVLYMDNFRYEVADTTSTYAYQGELEFDGTGKYITQDFLWFRGGLTGGVLTQPVIENGQLVTTVKGTPISFCFAAEEALKNHSVGDNVQVTVRAKFSNENVKIGYTTGTETWSELSSLGVLDAEGYRTFSFNTTVNSYRQPYMYQAQNESNSQYCNNWKNISFSIHYDFDKYIPDSEGIYPTIMIDYIRIQ